MISVQSFHYLYMRLSSVVHSFADVSAQKILESALSQPRNLCFSTLQVRMLPARVYPLRCKQSCAIMMNLTCCAEPYIRHAEGTAASQSHCFTSAIYVELSRSIL